jgi:hypothetical protein
MAMPVSAREHPFIPFLHRRARIALVSLCVTRHLSRSTDFGSGADTVSALAWSDEPE